MAFGSQANAINIFSFVVRVPQVTAKNVPIILKNHSCKNQYFHIFLKVAKQDMLILVRLGIRKDFWYLAEKRKEKRGEAGHLKNVSKYRAIDRFLKQPLNCYHVIFLYS